ncbi:coiled-coil domain-containing protein 134-like isoform X2 [Ostrea edulis]|uniref:coiled-coil domain-containing protein 134-like isoform X2 n=1 Tax=Ostrea edulis TaxID=37623 RepID=UPI002094AE7C|nr:coiled-coil domain-containing protein 134-like isoform X2 [Ostrea edulis]
MYLKMDAVRTTSCVFFCRLSVSLFISLSISLITTHQKEPPDVVKGQRSPIDMYKKLFEEHRAIQLEAVKSIQNFGDYKQRFKLVEMTLQKLFTVVNEAKANLTVWGYVPGDSFPDNTTIRDGLSKVFENTAMFGDLVLRLPDIVHAIYDKNKDWQLLIGWCYWFCRESGVFDGTNGKLLHLMAQEVNLIEKEENYINPFTLENQLKQVKWNIVIINNPIYF